MQRPIKIDVTKRVW